MRVTETSFLLLRCADELQEERNSCPQLQPRFVEVLSVLRLCLAKLILYVVRSALQTHVYTLVFFADQISCRSYVTRHIRLRFLAVIMFTSCLRLSFLTNLVVGLLLRLVRITELIPVSWSSSSSTCLPKFTSCQNARLVKKISFHFFVYSIIEMPLSFLSNMIFTV